MNKDENNAGLSVAMLGGRMGYAVPVLLHAAGRLKLFYSDYYSGRGPGRLLRSVPKFMRTGSMERLLCRDAGGIPQEKVVSFNRFGLDYVSRVRNASGGDLRGAYLWGGAEFNRLIIRNMDWDTGGVYAFNTAALGLFQEARQRGVKTILEQTIAPRVIESQIVSRQRDLFPGWEREQLFPESEAEYVSREKEEWGLADVIICGSSYVRDMLARAGGDASKCRVVSYGVNVPEERPRPRSRREGKLRVLFVGTLCLRKGIQYAAQAAEVLRANVEMVAVGPSLLTDKGMEMLGKSIKCVGPVPHARMKNYWDWADVLILPSLCEGSATVSYEALSRAIPVLCTMESGSIVGDKKDGLIFQSGSADALVECLGALLDEKSKLDVLSSNALMRCMDVSLSGYNSRLLGQSGVI